MDELGGIIIILVVFRVIYVVLRAWWHGDRHNDWRRDR